MREERKWEILFLNSFIVESVIFTLNFFLLSRSWRSIVLFYQWIFLSLWFILYNVKTVLETGIDRERKSTEKWTKGLSCKEESETRFVVLVLVLERESEQQNIWQLYQHSLFFLCLGDKDIRSESDVFFVPWSKEWCFLSKKRQSSQNTMFWSFQPRKELHCLVLCIFSASSFSSFRYFMLRGRCQLLSCLSTTFISRKHSDNEEQREWRKTSARPEERVSSLNVSHVNEFTNEMTKEKKSGSRRQRQKSVEEEEKEIKKQVIHEKRNISFSHLSRSQVALEVFLRTCVGLFVFVSVLSLLPHNASYSQCLSSLFTVSSWVAIPSHLSSLLLVYLCFLICVRLLPLVCLVALSFLFLYFHFCLRVCTETLEKDQRNGTQSIRCHDCKDSKWKCPQKKQSCSFWHKLDNSLDLKAVTPSQSSLYRVVNS